MTCIDFCHLGEFLGFVVWTAQNLSQLSTIRPICASLVLSTVLHRPIQYIYAQSRLNEHSPQLILVENITYRDLTPPWLQLRQRPVSLWTDPL